METYDSPPRKLRGINLFWRSLRKELARQYDEVFAESIIDQAQQEWDSIKPQLPDVGSLRENYYAPIVTFNGLIIALHRAMKANNKEAKDTIRVTAAMFDRFFGAIPGPLARLIGQAAFSKRFARMMQGQATRSQQRQFPEDWVYVCKTGGDDYDIMFEFSECAVMKLYDKFDVPELKPFCNFGDVTYSRYLNMGLDASETLGQGCTTCKLKYQRGSQTNIPPNLIGILPSQAE